MARAAGVGAVLIGAKFGKIFLKLSSGWQVSVNEQAFCVLGRSSNSLFKYVNLEKAGKQRALGFRPVVRGVAKNPCDHPHVVVRVKRLNQEHLLVLEVKCVRVFHQLIQKKLVCIGD